MPAARELGPYDPGYLKQKMKEERAFMQLVGHGLMERYTGYPEVCGQGDRSEPKLTTMWNAADRHKFEEDDSDIDHPDDEIDPLLWLKLTNKNGRTTSMKLPRLSRLPKYIAKNLNEEDRSRIIKLAYQGIGCMVETGGMVTFPEPPAALRSSIKRKRSDEEEAQPETSKRQNIGMDLGKEIIFDPRIHTAPHPRKRVTTAPFWKAVAQQQQSQTPDSTNTSPAPSSGTSGKAPFETPSPPRLLVRLRLPSRSSEEGEIDALPKDPPEGVKVMTMREKMETHASKTLRNMQACISQDDTLLQKADKEMEEMNWRVKAKLAKLTNGKINKPVPKTNPPVPAKVKKPAARPRKAEARLARLAELTKKA